MLQTTQQQQSIQVYVRVRPLLKKEFGQENILNCSEGKYIVIEQTTQIMKQEFDRVFNEQSIQRDLFSYIEPTIKQAIKGYNGTVLAYGQTGSGKTHTMFGSDWEYALQVSLGHQSTVVEDIQNDHNRAGIIPRTIFSLFQQLPEHCYVYCSFLQIYNEKVYDLLQDHRIPQALQLHESKADGIYVEGLTEYAVNNYQDCLTLMKRGERNRAIRATTMNLKSSRSHTMLQLIIESNKADNGGQLYKSKINLCDLAGSEKINKGGDMNDMHLLELKSINQSLTTLGKVIQSLSHNTKHNSKLPVPYRESKLTRLLQDSLGGNTLTHIIVNVAPNVYNIDETANSLKFAQRARNIHLQVSQNKINATDQALVNKLMKEIDYLKSILNMKRQGLNANDIHFKLMKMQEENERLRQHALSVQEVEKLMEENRKMKEEIQKLHSQSDTDTSQMNKYSSEESLFEQNPFKNNAMMIVSNPIFSVQRTEVQVRFKGKGNKMQTRQGYVEVSDQTAQKERRLMSERRRVLERLEYLEALQLKNSGQSIYKPPPSNHKYGKPPMGKLNKTVDDGASNVRYKLIERQLI